MKIDLMHVLKKMLNVTMSPHSDWSLRKVRISDCSLGTVGINKVLGALFSSEGAKSNSANFNQENSNLKKKHYSCVENQ